MAARMAFSTSLCAVKLTVFRNRSTDAFKALSPNTAILLKTAMLHFANSRPPIFKPRRRPRYRPRRQISAGLVNARGRPDTPALSIYAIFTLHGSDPPYDRCHMDTGGGSHVPFVPRASDGSTIDDRSGH